MGRIASILAVALILSSCAIHQFAPPSRTWTARNGQLSYRGKKTSLIGEVFVRYSNRGDFELTFSKGPGVTLLVMRTDPTFARVQGPLAAHSLVRAASTAAGAGQRLARLAPGNFAQSAKSNCAGE